MASASSAPHTTTTGKQSRLETPSIRKLTDWQIGDIYYRLNQAKSEAELFLSGYAKYKDDTYCTLTINKLTYPTHSTIADSNFTGWGGSAQKAGRLVNTYTNSLAYYDPFKQALSRAKPEPLQLDQLDLTKPENWFCEWKDGLPGGLTKLGYIFPELKSSVRNSLGRVSLNNEEMMTAHAHAVDYRQTIAQYVVKLHEVTAAFEKSLRQPNDADIQAIKADITGSGIPHEKWRVFEADQATSFFESACEAMALRREIGDHVQAELATLLRMEEELPDDLPMAKTLTALHEARTKHSKISLEYWLKVNEMTEWPIHRGEENLLFEWKWSHPNVVEPYLVSLFPAWERGRIMGYNRPSLGPDHGGQQC